MASAIIVMTINVNCGPDTMFEMTFGANRTFGLTGFKISQTELQKVRRKPLFTIALVVIKKNSKHNVNYLSDDLSDVFSFPLD